MTDLVGHFLLFTVLGVAFLLAPLVIGLFVRPANPTSQKLTAYECGEPTIGSSYVQFDLRFYVVALLFIIFDVEVAFFFPWAAVYGESTQLLDARLTHEARTELSAKLLNQPAGSLAADSANVISQGTAHTMALTGLADILVFFGVLLVGFAYVWKRGDLDWVRAMTQNKAQRGAAARPPITAVASTDRKLEPVA
ncbi:MAG: NADH-quinone oxidoreductase subunit A [Planctomycetia bacterium]|nr:NADH-quinone oxidoreductase subunit A [Planctomycetia bacterium]